MNRPLYSYGLPFSEKLKESLDDQRDRIKHNKASLIIIDGAVGDGKTTLAVELADYFNGANGLPLIDLNEPKQYAFGGEDFMEKLRLCFEGKLPVLVYDEAGDFSSRGALTKFNKLMNRCFETFRAFKIIVILCLPSFNSLDKSLLDKGISRLLIHCANRTTTGNFSVYGLYRMFYLREGMRKAICKPHAYKINRPNFYGHFLNLGPDRCKQLDILSTKNKMISLKEGEIAASGLISTHDIQKKLQRGRTWVSTSINKLKLKPKKSIRRLKYYDESILEILDDYKAKMQEKKN